jgi:hypothetical protein
MTKDEQEEALKLSKSILKLISKQDPKVAGYALVLALELLMFTMKAQS